MAELFKSDRISYWMSGRIESEYLYYFKQRRPSAAMVTLRFDFRNPKKVARLPTNLIPSGQIDMAFVEFFSAANAACGGDFDRLFVPFRCIATDAAARKEVVYRSRRSGQGDPRFDDHTVGFQTYQARLDAALRRRTVQ